ncbi:MAG: hypothetical protein CMJ83_06405 [Planctomycetes bacterium]|nr:hypothetical protein [Planctomycetota bacterium]
MLAQLITVVVLASGPTPAPDLLVTKDDTVVDRSCRIVIPNGTVITDANGNGVIHVKAANVEITFAKGSVLRGAPTTEPLDRLVGVGIRISGLAGVKLRRVAVSGFKVGIHVEGSDDLLVEDGAFTGNFAQRLKSTSRAEDSGDWLYPHDNDDHQWMKKYGASLYVERCRRPTLRRISVRRAQNGIILDRVTSGKIYDNDASFLSGWGLAMWRTTDCTVTRNAFDFCIRGYSHKVYNRGQDSAGILMFEQCSRNAVLGNSCTHGGDGIFGFAGTAALASTARVGNNTNVFVGNDLSYAAAHGLEMTFSFDNYVTGNRFVGNAICGIWAGYSQETHIVKNLFERNGGMAYGLERGGVNIEHGFANVIDENDFAANKCGVHLWSDTDEHLMKQPWVKTHHKGCKSNVVANNRFQQDTVGVHLRDATDTRVLSNQMTDVKTPFDFDGPSKSSLHGDWPDRKPRVTKIPEELGEARPVGSRAALHGRQNIVMTEWGPWDHASPIVRPISRRGGTHVYELLGVKGEVTIGYALPPLLASLGPADARGARKLSVTSLAPGVHRYRIPITAGGFRHEVSGAVVKITWNVRGFPWTRDPLQNRDAWAREAKEPRAVTATMASLELPFRNDGPSQMRLSAEVTAAGIGKDRFGVFASTVVPLKKGRWRLVTWSDDGIHATLDGRQIIEDWTIHGTRRHEHVFELKRDRAVRIHIQYFEQDGAANLSAALEPVE